VSQWVAHDLRMRLYDHLQSLSLRYCDTHRSGSLLSTITADVKTIQGFASSGTLGILVDLLSIVGMLGVMLWLDWDFALVAVAVTPFLLLFVARFNGVVKRATHEVRRYQSDIVSVTEEGLESMRSAAAAPQPAGHRRGSSAGTGHGACTRTTRSSTARCW
jgi:subfamily B ATP-binding cassette protein MsbA